MYGPAYCNGWNPIIPNGIFCEAALSNVMALNSLNAMTCQSIQSSMANVTNNLQAMTQQGILSPQECREMNVFYANNQPITIVSPYKPHLTIYDLDRLIFPEDPIRDWVTKRVAEIEKKFAWADQL